MSLSNLTIGWWNVYGGMLPPGMGNVFHLVTAKNSTDTYYSQLTELGVDDGAIFSALSTAYDAMRTLKGDTLCIYPGDHVQTASLTWDKDDTRVVGMGSANQYYQPSTLTSGGVRLTCKTAAVAQILSITGDYVQIHGIGTHNTAASASNLSDLLISGKNLLLNKCAIRGGTEGTTQLVAASPYAGIPLIFAGGNGFQAFDCMIGSSGNSARTKGSGGVRFGTGGGGTFAPKFVRCDFTMRCEIATNDNVGFITLVGNYCIDRSLILDNCNFYNFTENLGTNPTYVIRDACATTHQIIVKDSSYNKGFTSWTDAATYISVSTPVSHLTGGLGLNA